MLADAAVFPRDKTCGDGLTPRAIAELDRLGLGDWLRAHTRQPGPARARLRPDPAAALARRQRCPTTARPCRAPSSTTTSAPTAIKAGATGRRRRPGGRRTASRATGSTAVVVHAAATRPFEVELPSGWSWPTACARRWASCSGREWHRDTVYGVAGALLRRLRAESDDPWISSTSSCAARSGEILSGYGWIFPLGDGEVNLGVGTLATAKRPADIAIKPLMTHYADERREEFGLVRRAADADLARCCRWAARCRNVAGANWALIGDAAACVNPLNGEGIDYGLETGRLVAELIAEHDDLAHGLAGAAARPLRRGVLDRPPAGRPGHRAAAAAGARPGRHALATG